MKWIYAIAAVALFASSAMAISVEEEDVDSNDARLGYISIDNSGTTSLTFNATSIQNGVILALFAAVLAALILPLFFGGAAETESEYGYGYGQEQTGYYDEASGYAGYAKRSLMNNLGPVVEALAAGHKKYEEE